jgi:hypothetical protein
MIEATQRARRRTQKVSPRSPSLPQRAGSKVLLPSSPHFTQTLSPSLPLPELELDIFVSLLTVQSSAATRHFHQSSHRNHLDSVCAALITAVVALRLAFYQLPSLIQVVAWHLALAFALAATSSTTCPPNNLSRLRWLRSSNLPLLKRLCLLSKVS